MATSRVAAQEPKVIDFTTRMTPGSEALQWYNNTPEYAAESLKRKPAKVLRNTRHGVPTVNLFQRHQENLVCGFRWRESGSNTFTVIKSQDGAMVTIFPGEGTETPHLGLRLRLETHDPKYKSHDCILIWPL